jgi:hypothetical protein
MTHVFHENTNANNLRGIGEDVFGGMGVEQAQQGQNEGLFRFEDFLDGDSTTPVGGCAVAAGTITADADDNGTLALATGTSSGNEGTLITPDFGDLDVDSGSQYKAGFQALVQVDSVADVAILVGLMQQGDTIASNVSSGAVANTNALYCIHAGSINADLKFYAKYTDAGVGVTAATGSTALLAADTNFKAGIRIHPRPNGEGPEISFYLNNEKLHKVNVDDDSTIEDLTAMVGFVQIETQTTAAKTATIDWVAWYNRNASV